ncbi:MAG TPA: family 10 glycosylhydrolase [Gemmatimonadaceae bacterium]|nr:family 10 glycosylhydrolase [Gemmatimonadaceae bacterium]
MNHAAVRRSLLAALLAAGAALPSTAANAQSTAATPPAVARDFRAAWVASVANIDWPSRPGLSTWQQQAELVAMLDRAVALNMNAIILQVRPAADALYASELEPWSAYLTGVQGQAPEPYYDPLTFAVEKAHERGLELHAWFNPYRALHPSDKGPAARTHLSVTHPALVKKYGEFQWMDPGEPAVLERTLNVMLDVVKRYDVDGIHIDDYFYPYPIKRPGDSAGPDLQFPDSASYAKYRARGGKLARDDWRRHNVDTLIQQIYVRTKALKPWVKVGISPFGIWRPGYPAQIAGFDAYTKLYADSRLWLREGWVDYFTPQLYWPIAQTPQSYPVLLEWWAGENVHQRHLWPGHFTSRAHGSGWPPDELPQQIRLTRAQPGATGDVHFSMKALMPQVAVRRDSAATSAAGEAPVAERLLADVYAEPALVPASPWLAGGSTPLLATVTRGPDPATGAHVAQLATSGATKATWWTVRVFGDGKWRTYVLPGSQGSITLAPAGAPRPERVLVTAVDRNGIEGPVLDAR